MGRGVRYIVILALAIVTTIVIKQSPQMFKGEPKVDDDFLALQTAAQRNVIEVAQKDVRQPVVNASPVVALPGSMASKIGPREIEAESLNRLWSPRGVVAGAADGASGDSADGSARKEEVVPLTKFAELRESSLRSMSYASPQTDDRRMHGNEDPVSFVRRVRISDVFATLRNSVPLVPQDKYYAQILSRGWMGQVISVEDPNHPYQMGWDATIVPSPDLLYLVVKAVYFTVDTNETPSRAVHTTSIAKGYNRWFRRCDDYPDALFIESSNTDVFQLYFVSQRNILIGNWYRRAATADFRFTGTVLLEGS